MVTLSNRTRVGFSSLNLNEIGLNYVPFGPAHIRTRRYKDELIILKQKLGHHKEARKVWQYTLKIYQSESGRTAPETLEATLQFIDFLRENKNAKAAITLAENARQDLQASTPATNASIEWQKKLAHKLTAIRGH